MVTTFNFFFFFVFFKKKIAHTHVTHIHRLWKMLIACGIIQMLFVTKYTMVALCRKTAVKGRCDFFSLFYIFLSLFCSSHSHLIKSPKYKVKFFNFIRMSTHTIYQFIHFKMQSIWWNCWIWKGIVCFSKFSNRK